MSGTDVVPVTTGDILLVDDDPAVLRLLMQILSEGGYRVRPANSGELALRSVRVAPPALILLDILMSDLDGFEVCRRLKASEVESDVLEESLDLIIPEDLRAGHGAAMARLAAGGEFHLEPQKQLEREGIRKNGERFPIEISVANWEAGGEPYYTGIIRDISKRKEAESVFMENLESCIEKMESLKRLGITGSYLPPVVGNL